MRKTKVKTLLLSRLFPTREVENLGTLLSRIPTKGIEAGILWIADLVDWLRQPLTITEQFTLPWSDRQLKEVRIRFLVEFLEHNADAQRDLQDLVHRLLNETQFLGLFTMSSHEGELGVVASVADRLLKKVLPIYRHDRDLGEIVIFLFPRRDDHLVLWSLEPDLKDRMIQCLFRKAFADPQILFKLTRELRESMVFLTHLGLSLRLKREILLRWQFQSFARDPLAQNLRFILDNTELSAGILLGLEKGLDDTQVQIVEIYRRLESQGTSMTLVLYLERLQRKITRLKQLVRVYQVLKLEHLQGKTLSEENVGYKLFVELVSQGQAKRSLRALLSDNVRMLAKKIVDRTSHTGEHYLVSTLKEYKSMFWAAAGGGLLTFVTVLIKIYSGAFKLPLFSEGIVSWINYSGSFILMQMLHLTLATKQPSMTASALASKMVHLEKDEQVDEFVQEFARITRANFISAVGNIGLITVAAYLFHHAYINITGIPLLSKAAALSTIEHLHPFESMTLPFAALTGILLWLSSLVAGWVENFFIYAETPQALRQNILIQKSLGSSFAYRLAHVVEKHAGGLAGNISLGFFLSFTSIFGKFFGLPLEVRHVTLSTGSLVLAVLSHGHLTLETQAYLWLGIVMIGVLNFSVSFYFSFFLAARARGITKETKTKLFRRIFIQFLRNPVNFIFPLKN